MRKHSTHSTSQSDFIKHVKEGETPLLPKSSELEIRRKVLNIATIMKSSFGIDKNM